jgi:hypothetical protein
MNNLGLGKSVLIIWTILNVLLFHAFVNVCSCNVVKQKTVTKRYDFEDRER